MENPSRKCEICAEACPNQTKLPRHYIRRKFKAETHLDLSGEDFCDKCLFEIERDVYSVKELIERWTVTCEYDKCSRLANFYNCSWQYLSQPFSKSFNGKTNVVIAAFTTAHARLKLYSVLEQLDRRVLY